MKVSIIIPIYNVKKYLRRCVDSILSQTYSDIEIILVNDGSTDNCLEICYEYQTQDKRVVVINKQNGGLSDARNAGIDIANGDYIYFVDSDDYIDCYTIEKLMNYAILGADVVVSNFDRVSESTVIGASKGGGKVETYSSGMDFYRLIYLEKDRYLHCNLAWGKLYKASLFENIRYPVGKIHEDEFTTYKLLFKAGETVFVDEPLYHYYIREGSITSVKFTEKNLATLEALEQRYKYFLSLGDQPFIEYTRNSLLGMHILDYYRIEDKNTKKELRNRFIGLYKKEKANLSISKHCQYILFLYVPFLYKIIRSIV